MTAGQFYDHYPQASYLGDFSGSFLFHIGATLCVAGAVVFTNILFIAGCYFRKKKKPDRNRTPPTTHLFLFSGQLALVALLLFSFQFNSTAMMVETHQLAVECSRQLVNHTHTAVANDLDTAVGIVNNSVGHIQRMALLSEGERQLGALNLSSLSSNVSQQTVLRQHLWSYASSCLQIQNIRFSFGFLSADHFFMGYWLDDDWDVGFNLWATPPNNATTAKSVDIVAVYDVNHDGSPILPAQQTANLSIYPWYPDSPPHCSNLQCAVLQYPLPDNGTFVLFLARGELAHTVSSFFTKVPALDPQAGFLGFWIVEIPLLEIARIIIAQKQRGSNDSVYLLVMPDLTVLVSSEPYWEVSTMQSMADANSSLIAAVATELRRRGVLAGPQRFSFFYRSPEGEVWEVQGEMVSVFWYLLFTPYQSHLQAYFDPSPSFAKMIAKFCIIQYLTWAMFAYVVCVTSTTYVAHTFYLPPRWCQIVGHVAMALALMALVAYFGFLNIYLELFSKRSGPTTIITKCAAALAWAGSDQLRWEAVQSSSVMVMIIQLAALINALIIDAVDIGKLPVDTLNSNPAQRRRLLAYQWLYSSMFPEVQAVFGGGWLVYSGCLSWPNGSVVWLNSSNKLFNEQGCSFELGGALAATTAQYFAIDPDTLQLIEPAVWQLKNYWLFQQPWWVNTALGDPNYTLATLNPVVDPTGDMALSYSRQAAPDESWFVTAVNVSFQYLQQELWDSAEGDSGTIYLMSKDTKQLIATSTELPLTRNGHGLYADEWIDDHPEIRASYHWLREGGYLDGNDSVDFRRDRDGDTYYCSMIPLAADVQASVLGVDLVTVAVASYEDMHSGVSQLRNQVQDVFHSLSLWRNLFIFSGAVALFCFPLAYGTLLGWVDWRRWHRRKVLALVTKMLAELPPEGKAVKRLPPEPSAASVVDFCLGLPQYQRCPPPSRRAVKGMLARSFNRLRRTEAVRFIEACGLSPDEALAICLYTYELGDWSPMPRLFPGETSGFQLYTELNRALQSDDPDLLRYWQPLLHPLLAGLHKVQDNPFASIQALTQTVVRLSWWA
eukprot:EG_transcript_1543